MNGTRSRACRLLADPRVRTVAVKHRDRLGRMNTELAEAAFPAHGRRVVVLEAAGVEDGLVRGMTVILMSFCARLYGCRLARSRAERALRCAARDAGPSPGAAR